MCLRHVEDRLCTSAAKATAFGCHPSLARLTCISHDMPTHEDTCSSTGPTGTGGRRSPGAESPASLWSTSRARVQRHPTSFYNQEKRARVTGAARGRSRSAPLPSRCVAPAHSQGFDMCTATCFQRLAGHSQTREGPRGCTALSRDYGSPVSKAAATVRGPPRRREGCSSAALDPKATRHARCCGAGGEVSSCFHAVSMAA